MGVCGGWIVVRRRWYADPYIRTSVGGSQNQHTHTASIQKPTTKQSYLGEVRQHLLEERGGGLHLPQRRDLEEEAQVDGPGEGGEVEAEGEHEEDRDGVAEVNDVRPAVRRAHRDELADAALALHHGADGDEPAHGVRDDVDCGLFGWAGGGWSVNAPPPPPSSSSQPRIEFHPTKHHQHNILTVLQPMPVQVRRDEPGLAVDAPELGAQGDRVDGEALLLEPVRHPPEAPRAPAPARDEQHGALVAPCGSCGWGG